jgi:hypothetical protein
LRSAEGRIHGNLHLQSSSKESFHQLELWYLAMDSAHPEVPPRLAIPSTPGKDVKPETVADATLAAQGADGKDFIGRRFVC